MHTFARNYVGSFNGRHGRMGKLCEGRYEVCLEDSANYFLARSRYIEINPVHAWMAQTVVTRDRVMGPMPTDAWIRC